MAPQGLAIIFVWAKVDKAALIRALTTGIHAERAHQRRTGVRPWASCGGGSHLRAWRARNGSRGWCRGAKRTDSERGGSSSCRRCAKRPLLVQVHHVAKLSPASRSMGRRAAHKHDQNEELSARNATKSTTTRTRFASLTARAGIRESIMIIESQVKDLRSHFVMNTLPASLPISWHANRINR